MAGLTAELRFRIFDGTDLCHGNYTSFTTVAFLKQKLLSEWPQDKAIVPKSIKDISLIHAGRIMSDKRTLANSRVKFGNPFAEVVTVLVVIQLAEDREMRDRDNEERQSMNSCCTIL